MSSIALPADVPSALAEMAKVAANLNAVLAVFDPADRIAYVSDRKREVYSFCNFDEPMTFEQLLRRSWEHGAQNGAEVPRDPDLQLMIAKSQRMDERLEFTRRWPVKLICSHVRIPSGWSAQLRVEPQHCDLDHYFAEETPVPSVVEAIRRGEEARQRAAALDCLALGVVVTGLDGTIRHRNAAMTELLARRDGLEIDEFGRLRARDRNSDTSLRRLIALAAAGRLPDRQAALCIRRSVPGEPHTVSVSQGLAQLDGAAVVMVAPPRFDTASLASILHRDFGMSAAEADLAALIGNGMSNDDASLELGKSPETGRSQLKAIFKGLRERDIGATTQAKLSRFAAVLATITGAARSRGI